MLLSFEIKFAFLYAMTMMGCLVPGVLSWEGSTERESCLQFWRDRNDSGSLKDDDGSFRFHRGERDRKEPPNRGCQRECQPECGEGDCNSIGYLVCAPLPPTPPTESEEEARRKAEKRKEEDRERKIRIDWFLGMGFGIPVLRLLFVLGRYLALCYIANWRGLLVVPAEAPRVPPNAPPPDQFGQLWGNEGGASTEAPVSA